MFRFSTPCITHATRPVGVTGASNHDIFVASWDCLPVIWCESTTFKSSKRSGLIKSSHYKTRWWENLILSYTISSNKVRQVFFSRQSSVFDRQEVFLSSTSENLDAPWWEPPTPSVPSSIPDPWVAIAWLTVFFLSWPKGEGHARCHKYHRKFIYIILIRRFWAMIPGMSTWYETTWCLLVEWYFG